MAQMTESFQQWCIRYHKEIFVPLMFGHIELLTEELQNEYLEWCKSDEGKQYLKGGSKYKERV